MKADLKSTIISTADKLYPLLIKVATISGALNAWDKNSVPIDENILAGFGWYLQDIEEELKVILKELEELD